jgi:hypothetical protein
LGEGLDKIDLTRFLVEKAGQNKNKADSTPFNYRGIGMPEIDTRNLLTTMRAKSRFPFHNCPAWKSLLMK